MIGTFTKGERLRRRVRNVQMGCIKWFKDIFSEKKIQNFERQYPLLSQNVLNLHMEDFLPLILWSSISIVQLLWNFFLSPQAEDCYPDGCGALLMLHSKARSPVHTGVSGNQATKVRAWWLKTPPLGLVHPSCSVVSGKPLPLLAVDYPCVKWGSKIALFKNCSGC